MRDWAEATQEMLAAKELLREQDLDKLWRHEGPRPPATPEDLCEVESAIGRALDGEYMSFLRRFDGWPAFLQDIDLFGSKEFRGRRFEEARDLVEILEPEVLEASNIETDWLVPIGAARDHIDILVSLHKPDSPDLSTPVIWLAGLEVERFDTFSIFFNTAIAYNFDEARRLRRCSPP
jgi:hypothetical protein